jgi:gliding motility-associated lipoprotein GldH
LTLRTTSDFPYRNLWIYLTIDGPAGKSRKLPLNIITADPSGRWTGDKSGSVVTFDTLLVNHNRFPKKGQYTFSFEQATTQKNLPEVLDLTLDLYSDKK